MFEIFDANLLGIIFFSLSNQFLEIDPITLYQFYHNYVDISLLWPNMCHVI